MTNEKKSFDVIIIGGGAGGLFCAVNIKNIYPDLSVAILEKQKTAGKKLLATGNGRCNLTNLNVNPDLYHGSFKPSIDNLLKMLSAEKLINEFNQIGLLTTVDSEGRVYPLSKHSSSVLEVLTLSAEAKGINIYTESFVTQINNSNKQFIVKTTNDTFYCKKLIVATGSKATPETGADDSMLEILKSLGHTVTPLYPALCPVNVNSKLLYNLKGVRVNGKASIIKDNKIIKSELGEIQFTEKSLSGICLFNLSRIANTSDNTIISLDLLPDMTENEVLKLLTFRKNNLPKNYEAENLLSGIFQKKLANTLLLSASINKNRPIKDIDESALRQLTVQIKNWSFKVKKSDDFTRAQVVAGGINGNEINEHTMESKLIKNLYLIGEVVDCDGDCGGFNLHFAFASAYCAANNITK